MLEIYHFSIKEQKESLFFFSLNIWFITKYELFTNQVVVCSNVMQMMFRVMLDLNNCWKIKASQAIILTIFYNIYYIPQSKWLPSLKTSYEKRIYALQNWLPFSFKFTLRDILDVFPPLPEKLQCATYKRMQIYTAFLKEKNIWCCSAWLD